jgi:hypothetical protein
MFVQPRTADNLPPCAMLSGAKISWLTEAWSEWPLSMFVQPRTADNLPPCAMLSGAKISWLTEAWSEWPLSMFVQPRTAKQLPRAGFHHQDAKDTKTRGQGDKERR